MVTIPTVSLNDGTAFPQLGFGTYKLTGDDGIAAIGAAALVLVGRAARIRTRRVQIEGTRRDLGELLAKGRELTVLLPVAVTVRSQFQFGFKGLDLAL